MKKNILNWVSIIMMAFVCVGFTACGDSDDNDNSGSGGGTTKFNGQSYNLTYGFWDAGTSTLYFEFSNYNLANKNPSVVPDKIDILTVSVKDISSPQPGTYNATVEFYSFAPTVTEETYYPGGYGKGVNLTITKSGDKYTFTIPETSISYYPNGKRGDGTCVPFSFSWTGTLTNYDFSE